MELTQILLIVGAIAAVVLVIIAIRGSFKSDDAFYGESPTIPSAGGSVDEGQERGSPDGDGGTGHNEGGSGDNRGDGDGD
jgi:hypothetical protein